MPDSRSDLERAPMPRSPAHGSRLRRRVHLGRWDRAKHAPERPDKPGLLGRQAAIPVATHPGRRQPHDPEKLPRRARKSLCHVLCVGFSRGLRSHIVKTLPCPLKKANAAVSVRREAASVVAPRPLASGASRGLARVAVALLDDETSDDGVRSKESRGAAVSEMMRVRRPE